MPGVEGVVSNATDSDRRGGRSEAGDDRQGNRFVKGEVDGFLAVLRRDTDTKGGGKEREKSGCGETKRDSRTRGTTRKQEKDRIARTNANDTDRRKIEDARGRTLARSARDGRNGRKDERGDTFPCWKVGDGRRKT